MMWQLPLITHKQQQQQQQTKTLFNTYNQMIYNTIYKKTKYDITMTDWLQKKTTKKKLQKYYKNTTEKDYKT